MFPKRLPLFLKSNNGFSEVYGNMNLYSMQGLKNLNSFSKLNYFRQTSRNVSQFTSTLLEKMNRMNLYHLG